MAPQNQIDNRSAGDQTALCLSGGGVRSAAFSIGVLQALNEARGKNRSTGDKATEKGRDFAYLSTVSGGGFAGAWYVSRPDDRLKELESAGTYLDHHDKKRHSLNGPAELVLVYLSKLLLFWLFAVPALWTFLLALAGIGLGGYALALAITEPARQMVAVAAALLFVLLVGVLQLRKGRYYIALTFTIALGCLASAYLVFGNPSGSINTFAISGGGITTVAFVSMFLRSSKLTEVRWLTRVLGLARVIRIGAWVGILVLLVIVTQLLVWVVQRPVIQSYLDLWPELNVGAIDAGPLFLIPLFALVVFICGLLPAEWVSIAGFYRERICEGFGYKTQQSHRTIHHLVNTADNFSSSQRDWDERKAKSFAWPFELVDGKQPGADYWRAIAISAAVAGPRMGSYTARPIGLLLLLFNIRLGQGFRTENRIPQCKSDSIYRAVKADIFPPKEDAENRNDVYLSDGGHFDNLGLYEVVSGSRKCKQIIVVDGGCDPHYKFSDLANAIRKIRKDHDVEIEIDGLRWTDNGETLDSPAGKQRQRVYGGSVRYRGKSGTDEIGEIVYIKAALIGDEPADVAGYADLHPDFPHESTSDQWFSESQFESYRRLGEYTVLSALRNYEEAKSIWTTESENKKDKDADENKDRGPDAVDLVRYLREAGLTVGRPELRPNLAGTILWKPQNDKETQRKFLLVESSGGGAWVLPKGHIERGESVAECARRELKEEAGYDLKRDQTERRIVIADHFERRKKIEHCHYLVRRLPDGMARKKGFEERPVLWVTADDYEKAGKEREGSKNANANTGARRDAKGDGPVETLSRARLFLGELLWLFDEANRKLDKHDKIDKFGA